MMCCCELPEVDGEHANQDTEDKSFRERLKSTMSSEFTAVVHANFIKTKLFMTRYHFSDAQWKEWLVAQTADSASVNIKTAVLLGIPHVPCTNHLLNHEVETMVDATKEDENGIGKVCHSTHITMSKVKGSNKNSSCLRKHTKLRPTIANDTRWVGKAQMMKKYELIRPFLVVAQEDDDAAFPMDNTKPFRKAAQNATKVLSDIKCITDSLQKKGLAMNDCRILLNQLIVEAHSKRNGGIDDSHWKGNKLGTTYISADSEKIPTKSKHFVSGVIKIQNNSLGNLTADERKACLKLKVYQDEGDNDGALSFQKRVGLTNAKKRKTCETSSSGYHNANFILGSAAEVERCWSVAKYVRSPERAQMAGEVFEAIMLLRYNRRFWVDKVDLIGQATDMAANAMRGEMSVRIRSLLLFMK